MTFYEKNPLQLHRKIRNTNEPTLGLRHIIGRILLNWKSHQPLTSPGDKGLVNPPAEGSYKVSLYHLQEI